MCIQYLSGCWTFSKYDCASLYLCTISGQRTPPPLLSACLSPICSACCLLSVSMLSTSLSVQLPVAPPCLFVYLYLFIYVCVLLYFFKFLLFKFQSIFLVVCAAFSFCVFVYLSVSRFVNTRCICSLFICLSLGLPILAAYDLCLSVCL